ncbi:MAG TPA: hypothetical protein VFI91_05555 [Longimicrobiaceae bacterium]|nr:hypothetical protein [Longimicrobiaceae bacterium]
MANGSAQKMVQATAVLEELGFNDARVTTAGPNGEIAAITVAPADWERAAGEAAAEIADRLKKLGFRYVALDLETSSS